MTTPSLSSPSLSELRAAWTARSGVATAVGNRAAINLLADGKPATATALAEARGTSVDQARASIEEARRHGVEVDDGAIVGMALTLRPTKHRFRVRGNDLYTWCGWDALFLSIMLSECAEVASSCPVTGTEIHLVVEADGTISAVSPDTVVVAIVGQQVTACCSVAGPDSEICTQMPFFATREAGERWQADHPGVAIVDLDDAREIARAYVQTR